MYDNKEHKKEPAEFGSATKPLHRRAFVTWIREQYIVVFGNSFIENFLFFSIKNWYTS